MTDQNQNNQMSQQQQEQIRKNTEGKTIVNGKVVPLKYAQQAEEMYHSEQAQQGAKTGIQEHHNNSGETVQTGKFASSNAQQQMMKQEQEGQNIKQANLQSGQEHLEQHLQSAQQQVQQNQQQVNQNNQAQQQAQARATTKKAKTQASE